MALKTLAIKLETVSPDPANVRRHPEDNIKSIMASLRAFGQQTPIVVDARNIILKGNGTYEAARRLGWDKIDAVRTTLDGSSAVAYAIADNRTAEKAEWDNLALGKTLRELESSLDSIEITGFTSKEIDRLLDDAASQMLQDSVLSRDEDDDETHDEEERNETDEEVPDAFGVRTLVLAYTGSEFEEALSIINALKSKDVSVTSGIAVLRALRSYAQHV
jgi:hypothetical protein